LSSSLVSSSLSFFFFLLLPPPSSPLFPYTTLFRSERACVVVESGRLGGEHLRIRHARFDGERDAGGQPAARRVDDHHVGHEPDADRKSTRLNSSHRTISYAVFCLKKKKKKK